MQTPTYLTGAIFAKSYKALREAVTRGLGKHGLSPTAWTFLGAVAQSPNGIRLVELADRLGVKAPFVTALGHDLVERGLVERAQHQFDKRAKLLVLTRKGKQFVAEVEMDVEAELRALLIGLNDSDLTAYQKVLDTIVANSEHQSTQV
jgi:MarR family transcriptional regulator for hemolysin